VTTPYSSAHMPTLGALRQGLSVGVANRKKTGEQISGRPSLPVWKGYISKLFYKECLEHGHHSE